MGQLRNGDTEERVRISGLDIHFLSIKTAFLSLPTSSATTWKDGKMKDLQHFPLPIFSF
jgi:hypothetical protein